MRTDGFKAIWTVALPAVMVIQAIAIGYFVYDIYWDIVLDEYDFLHAALEIAANAALVSAVVIEALFFRILLRQRAEAERTISAASGALGKVIDDYYTEWGLTPAEADVATFTIKGYSIAEVARMRGSAEGTIKNHLNSIYRKAGLTGRAQLVSLLIEDLLNNRLSEAEPDPSAPPDGQTFARPASAAAVGGWKTAAASGYSPPEK